MNCLNHPETPAVAFCRSCGKPLCDACRRPAQGSVFCEEHEPAAQAIAPPPPAVAYTAPSVRDPNVSPALAFTLGLIVPGVGAIYNGQYAKGLVHAIIFGLLVSILSSGSAGGLAPLFGVLIAVWVFYMAIEAHQTAQKRRAGQPVDEFSSLIDLHTRGGSRFPAGAVLLIVVGVLLLLSTTDIIPLERVLRYWPALLIVLGVYLLYSRLTGTGAQDPGTASTQEVHDDHR
jgi:TM2 domain-containing membrane protein YozV